MYASLASGAVQIPTPRRGAFVAVALSLLLAGPSDAWAEPSPGEPEEPAHAPPPPERRRPPVEWNRIEAVGASTYFTAWILGAGTLAVRNVTPSPVPWRGRDPLDEAWRNAFRSPSVAGRVAAEQLSNGLDAAVAGFVLVDVALPFARSPEETRAAYGAAPSAEARAAWIMKTTSWQLVWIDAQAVALSTFVQNVMAHGASRERPYVRLCGTAAALPDGSDCSGDYRYQSFYSGHTSLAFTVAGLTCVHHAYLPLYGGAAADASACIMAEALAATVGVLRTVADQHYLTDVLTGLGVGTLSGVGIPLLYYRTGLGSLRFSTRLDGFSATLLPTPTGGSVVGRF